MEGSHVVSLCHRFSGKDSVESLPQVGDFKSITNLFFSLSFFYGFNNNNLMNAHNKRMPLGCNMDKRFAFGGSIFLVAQGSYDVTYGWKSLCHSRQVPWSLRHIRKEPRRHTVLEHLEVRHQNGLPVGLQGGGKKPEQSQTRGGSPNLASCRGSGIDELLMRSPTTSVPGTCSTHTYHAP